MAASEWPDTGAVVQRFKTAGMWQASNATAPSNKVTGSVLTFGWAQIAGPSVDLATPDATATSFVAPVSGAGAELVFRHTVSGGVGLSTDDVSAIVESAPQATVYLPFIISGP